MIALALVRRDLAEHRMLFPVALGLGLLALAAPALPGLLATPAEIRSASAGVFGLALGTFAALAQGACLGRDLASGRLAFWLTRPIGPEVLVASRLGAGLLLALSLTLLALLPTLALHPDTLGSTLRGLGPFSLGFLFLLSVVHPWSLVLRHRTPMLLADVALLVATLLGAWLLQRAVGAYDANWRGLTAYLLATGAYGLAGLLGAFLQVRLGHGDLRRSHRALTATMAVVLALAAGAGLALVHRCTSHRLPARADALTVGAVHGDWSVVAEWPKDDSKGAFQPYLLHLPSGVHHSLPPGAVALSDEGNRAVWERWEPSPLPWRPGTIRLEVADLVGTSVHLRRSIMAWDTVNDINHWAISPQGRTLVAAGRRHWHVVDLDSGVLVKTLDHDSRYVENLSFEGESLVRYSCWGRGSGADVAGTLNLRTFQRQEHPFWTTPPASRTFFSLSLKGDRLLRRDADETNHLLDFRSGQTLASFSREDSLRMSLLEDSSLLSLVPRGPGLAIRTWDPDGRPQASWPLPAGEPTPKRVRVLGIPAPGQVLLGFAPTDKAQRYALWRVDRTTGTFTRLAEDGMPVGPQTWPRRPSELLYLDHQGRLMRAMAQGEPRAVPGVTVALPR